MMSSISAFTKCVAGIPKKDVIDKRISPMVESYMEKRQNYVMGESRDEFTACDSLERRVGILSPIVGSGDVMGAVIVLTNANDTAPSQTDVKLVQVAAGFLGRQMEE